MALSACRTETDERGRELTKHGSALFPIACYHDRLPPDEVPWHWHEELEAIWVEAGTLLTAVDGETYPLPQGSGCFINAGVLHSVWVKPGETCVLRSLVFHPRLVGGSLDSIFWQGYLQPVLDDTSARCVELSGAASWHGAALEAVQTAWRACAEEGTGYEFTVREQLSQLVLLLSTHRERERRPPSEKIRRDAERMKRMLQYAQDHLEEELSVAVLAASAAISESECLRCFRSVIGTTPMRYVRQIRLQRAAELLRDTEEPVSAIGALCGFQEMSYFAKTFRAERGCTPSDYRKKSRPA